MLWPVLISGFTLGAAGSFHCIGMCGPLSLALPVHQLSPVKKFLSLLLYQFGRILTYSSLGLLFGLAGRRIYISGYQQGFSIAMGALVLTLAIIYYVRHRIFRTGLLNKFYAWLQGKMIGLLRNPSARSFLLLGMANGLLPCGMIYVALAATVTFSNVGQSVGFMAMFGAGTLPAMMLAGYASHLINPAWRSGIRKMIPLLMSLMGILLILRGMNLGIPFISPAFPENPGAAVDCHP